MTVDLEFDDRDTAERFLEKLHGLWQGPARAIVQNPETWILETVESRELDRPAP